VTIPYILLQIVFAPILAVVVVAAFGPRIGKKIGWVAVASLIYTTVLLLVVGADLFNDSSPILEEYTWVSVPSITLKFGFLADGLSLPAALVMNLIVTACAAYSFRYMEHRIEDLYGKGRNGMYTVYYAAYLLFATGLVGVALSTNLIELYIFLELVLIPSYLHIALFGYVDKERIALMYFIWNHIGAGIFLIGIVLTVFGNGGNFEISSMSSIAGTPIAFWVVFLVLVGWLVKMATFGFHVWLPWAHGEHPTSIAAIIATIVGLGTYAIVRLIVAPLFVDFTPFGMPLMYLALITMIYGALLTLARLLSSRYCKPFTLGDGRRCLLLRQPYSR
jgi:NADH-quinone oxidoreductase subunit M